MSLLKSKTKMDKVLQKFSLAVLAAAAVSIAATAQEASPAEALSAEAPVNEKCFSADGLVKHVKKMNSQKPKRLDTLHAVMSAKWKRLLGEDPYPNMWTRQAGVDTPLSVLDDGFVSDFNSRLLTLSKGAEICGQKSADLVDEEPRFSMEIDSEILFKNATGPYSIAELQDGVGDGKSFYKKMMPGPLSLLVPKMTHLTLDYADENQPLAVRYTKEGTAVDAPPYEMFGTSFVIALEDIEASGADMMHVEGGPFKLIPTPSIKKMKSLGVTSGDEAEDEAEDNK